MGKNYISFRCNPINQGGKEKERIWFVERSSNGWSKSKLIDDVVLAHPTHWTLSLAKNSNLYFTSEKAGVKGGQDIYVARYDGKKYLQPEDPGDAINSEGKDFATFIAPDESYLIFTRIGKETKKTDLFISYKKPDGSWTKAIDMGSSVNSEYHDLTPYVSPDGKYLFFINQREQMNGMHWMDAKIIEELRPKE